MGAKSDRNGIGAKKKINSSEKITAKNDKSTFDPLSMKWVEKYDKVFEKLWTSVPSLMKPTLVTLSIFTLGTTIRGEWVLILVHAMKQFGLISTDYNTTPFSWDNISLESFRLKGLGEFLLWSSVAGYFVYFLIGGFIHWYFYVRQRDRPQDWKCQPTKFMDPELERHEIIFGSLNLLCNSCVSAVIACYIANGGYNAIYYEFTQYGWIWLFLQLPVVFIYQDYCAYWMHRIFHFPFLYKHFHKMHHKYKQPTAFSVTALHPVESITMQMVMIFPIFVVPMHWLMLYILVLYVYYHGIIDHSGVNFKAFWWQPWQPDAIFHDNHHQYFHVNFGFNIEFWDKLHGTMRKKDRIYHEDIYYGQGKSIKDASVKEVENDMDERLSENPLAYRSNKLDFLEGMDKNKKKTNKKQK